MQQRGAMAIAIIIAIAFWTLAQTGNTATPSPVLGISGIDAPADGECATWQQAGFGIEWQTCGGGNAATADALTNNPTDCASSGRYAYAIAANGDLTCAPRPWAVATARSSVTADDDDILQLIITNAGTMGAFWCSTDTGVATANVDRRPWTTPNTTGDSVVTSIGCDSDTERTVSFGVATTSPDYVWNISFDSVSGSGQIVRFFATGTYDE